MCSDTSPPWEKVFLSFPRTQGSLWGLLILTPHPTMASILGLT